MINLPERYSHDGCEACGGFSKVLFCQDNILKRKVAIKFIQDEREIHRIFDELKALMQLRSKHVVQIYDIIPYDGSNFGIVEEFIEGEDLVASDYPRQSLENYLKILWQIAAGIAEIHLQGIIHRDIKPNNMKIDNEGIVKIFDFGLARDEGPEAETKGFRGTYGFAAPELFSTTTVSFSNAIDIYAFGALSVYLAFKLLPSELLQLPPLPLPPGFIIKSTLNIPETICDLLEKCLCTNPISRPSMKDIRDCISKHILKNKHQAVMIYKGKKSLLNRDNDKVTLEYPSVGKLNIKYDGMQFIVSNTEGEVFINNNKAYKDMIFPGSCIISLGDNNRKANNRAFIAFDISNPEVVL